MTTPESLRRAAETIQEYAEPNPPTSSSDRFHFNAAAQVLASASLTTPPPSALREAAELAEELERRLKCIAKDKPYSFLGPEIDVCLQIRTTLPSPQAKDGEGGASGIPTGFRRIEAYTDFKEVIIMGGPGQFLDGDDHNCDAMGCGSLGHVIARLPASPAPQGPDVPPEVQKAARAALTQGYPNPQAVVMAQWIVSQPAAQAPQGQAYDALIRISVRMANLCFNLKQWGNIPECVKTQMEELQKAWDKALASATPKRGSA